MGGLIYVSYYGVKITMDQYNTLIALGFKNEYLHEIFDMYQYKCNRLESEENEEIANYRFIGFWNVDERQKYSDRWYSNWCIKNMCEVLGLEKSNPYYDQIGQE